MHSVRPSVCHFELEKIFFLLFLKISSRKNKKIYNFFLIEYQSENMYIYIWGGVYINI
jgi:hypothetical protein